jgi:hypothetical protein
MASFFWRKRKAPSLKEAKGEQREEFSLQDFVKKYPEEIRQFLLDYGQFLHPEQVLDHSKKSVIPGFSFSIEEANEIYILATETGEEVDKYWKKKHSNLASKGLTGTKVADALRAIYREKIEIESKKTPEAKLKALRIFPILEKEKP